MNRYRAIPSSATGHAVGEVLTAFETLCMRCVVAQTGHRFGDVLEALDALHARVAGRRCALCAEDWPVFKMPRRALLGRRRAA